MCGAPERLPLNKRELFITLQNPCTFSMYT
jgi:hypothetical protein